MEKKHLVLLILLALGVLALRLWFVFSTPHLDSDAYLGIRIVDHIRQHGTLPTHDPLSYGGRLLLVSPLFYYLTAGIAWLIPPEVATRLLPQLLMAALPLIVFGSVYKLTKESDAALFSAILTAFTPVAFRVLFTFSPLVLALPLTFLAALTAMYLPKKRAVMLFIMAMLALAITHHSSLFLIGGVAAYLLIARLERLRLAKAELEVTLFVIFIYLWLQFLLYKRVFLSFSQVLIQQNVPAEIAAQYFFTIPPISIIAELGIIPVILGVYGIYKYLFRVKNKYIYLYIALSVSIALLVWLRLIRPAIGLPYLAVCLSILAGPVFVLGRNYFNKTRIAAKPWLWHGLLVLAVVAAMLIPSLYAARAEQRATVPPELYAAMEWLGAKTPPGSTILTTISEGHLVTAVAQRKNVADSYFILTRDAARRVRDIRRIFTTPFPTEAVELLTRYRISYIVLSDSARAQFEIADLPTGGMPCLSKVYDHGRVAIYRSQCRLEVTA